MCSVVGVLSLVGSRSEMIRSASSVGVVTLVGGPSSSKTSTHSYAREIRLGYYTPGIIQRLK